MFKVNSVLWLMYLQLHFQFEFEFTFAHIFKSQKMNSSVNRMSQRAFSLSKNLKNKENESDWMKNQKDIYGILEHFNAIIIQNNNDISQLQNKIDSIESKGYRSHGARDFQQEKTIFQRLDSTYNDIDQTKITLHRNSIINVPCRQTQQQFDDINKKIEHLACEMKRKQNQSQFRLQKRLSYKGDKTEIQKALNLSKLLAVQINMIQERFKQNQRTSKVHDQKISQIQRSLFELKENIKQDKTLQSQNNWHISVQNQNLSHIQNLKADFETQLETVTEQTQLKIQEVKQFLQTKSMKNDLQSQLDSIYSRLVVLQSREEQQQEEKQKLSEEIKSQIDHIRLQSQIIANKTIKDNEQKVCKKLESWEKLYTKRTDFLSIKQQSQNSITKINQNINKLGVALNNRLEKLQKSHHSLNSIVQYTNNSLQNNLSKLQTQQNTLMTDLISSIQKDLSKYAKTDNIKKYLESENQKIQTIINNSLEQQKNVNEVLCSENILGRWLWQGQQLKGGNLVSWDKQVINTLPENFKYSAQKSNVIEIANGGIYKFELGFYGKKKPTIQILINGKTVMSAVNSSSYVIHHSSGKLKGIQPGQMSGLTLVDFFLIPENSRIAIAYNGDLKGEGFLNIHRL